MKQSNKGLVSRDNFLCKMQCNAIAKQVAEEIVRVTPRLQLAT